MENKGELLNQLRIDRNAPEPRSPVRWIVGVVVLVALLVAGAWWMLGTNQALVVEAAPAIAPTRAGSGATAVLQATG